MLLFVALKLWNMTFPNLNGQNEKSSIFPTFWVKMSDRCHDGHLAAHWHHWANAPERATSTEATESTKAKLAFHPPWMGQFIGAIEWVGIIHWQSGQFICGNQWWKFAEIEEKEKCHWMEKHWDWVRIEVIQWMDGRWLVNSTWNDPIWLVPVFWPSLPSNTGEVPSSIQDPRAQQSPLSPFLLIFKFIIITSFSFFSKDPHKFPRN